MKVCIKCKDLKPLEDFYKHPNMKDGHLNKCKCCVLKYSKDHYQDNRKKYAAYEKIRCQDSKRKKKIIEYQRNRRRKYPEKVRAYRNVKNAIKTGDLDRLPCEVCGEDSEAHHYDYNRPLDVTWLCRKHHLEVHGKKAYI